MMPARGVLPRILLLGLAAVVLQVGGVIDIRLLGGSPDLVPLVVAGAGVFGGSVSGAAAGFWCGLVLDLALGLNLGATSLVLTPVGYMAGRYREVRDPSHALAPIAIGAVATAAYVIGTSAVSFMLSVEASVSTLLLREMLATIVLNSLLALPIFRIVRRTLRPTLVADRLSRRAREGRRREPGVIGPYGPRGSLSG